MKEEVGEKENSKVKAGRRLGRGKESNNKVCEEDTKKARDSEVSKT